MLTSSDFAAEKLPGLDLELNVTQVDDDRLEHPRHQEHPHRHLQAKSTYNDTSTSAGKEYNEREKTACVSFYRRTELQAF